MPIEHLFRRKDLHPGRRVVDGMKQSGGSKDPRLGLMLEVICHFLCPEEMKPVKWRRSVGVVKLLRVHGGCLGIERR